MFLDVLDLFNVLLPLLASILLGLLLVLVHEIVEHFHTLGQSRAWLLP